MEHVQGWQVSGIFAVTTPLSNGYWKKALASAGSIAIGVTLGELAIGDLSHGHFLHSLEIIGFTILFAELRYWKMILDRYADKGNDGT